MSFQNKVLNFIAEPLRLKGFDVEVFQNDVVNNDGQLMVTLPGGIETLGSIDYTFKTTYVELELWWDHIQVVTQTFYYHDIEGMKKFIKHVIKIQFPK